MFLSEVMRKFCRLVSIIQHNSIWESFSKIHVNKQQGNLIILLFIFFVFTLLVLFKLFFFLLRLFFFNWCLFINYLIFNKRLILKIIFKFLLRDECVWFSAFERSLLVFILWSWLNHLLLKFLSCHIDVVSKFIIKSLDLNSLLKMLFIVLSFL